MRHRNCEYCRSYGVDYQKYVTVRQEYKNDVEKQNIYNTNSEIAYFAADLEKMTMLPRMEEFKIVMFCPRVILFIESFVPIGEKWYEAISGRKMGDIASCFRAFL